MKTIRALLSDIIEIIDTLEMLKAPKFPAHAPAEGGPHLEVTEFAKTVAEALEKAQLGEVENVSEEASADDAPVWEKARQAVAEAQVNPEGDPEENAHQAAMTTPEAEPEAPPAKTRKPRTPAKAPKPDPVDFDAVRVEVAASISSLVEQGKKENIKELLGKYKADRAREISDENIVAFRDELILL